MSIHAAHPAASAPGAPFSTGMMRSISRSSVRNSGAVKLFGVYGPAADAWASAVMWWTSAAATRSSAPVAIRASPSLRSASRREISDITLPQFFREVLGRAPCQRDDRVGGILVGVADERRRVRYEQVLHLVSLAELVQRARARIVAHAHGADFMDDRAAA